ncbi:LysR family transcriptional regulator [Sphingorhabdus sp. YGSMI21]|uniref:LysR family transcriptional regulator n=1 Tax=Sphingorhabdus sp. YGSMI21 TaxID=2077182 RepID=UPI000C1E34B5|nr:LysR family transcriptional regulator [Sphingorhabdus sp. YGSMI21]ATW02250.1 LysR family transcriptional regulator [Sphingorhabdus sp. YGSMI21]
MEIWDLNLRHLYAAKEICDKGSISAAADAVNLTQPAITQGLVKLETQLGQPLFERHTDGMSPTPAATIFAPRIEAALANIGSTRVTMAQVRAFLSVAEHGSYPTASAMSGLAQPSLHRSVANLAIALKRKLLERRGKGMALTGQGRALARSFRLARAELVAGLSELEALKGRETGTVAIGAMPLCRARLLPKAVSQFHKAYPESEIRIIEGSHAELIEPLRDGELDFLVGALRDPVPGDDVQQQSLFEDHPVIIGRRDHPLRNQPGDLQKLASYPWIIAAPGTPLRMRWEQMFESAGIECPDVPIECGSVITIRQILLESDFLTLLSPDQVAVELEAEWLSAIGQPPEGLHRTIGVTTRTGWMPTAMQRDFLAMLEQAAKD